MKLTIILLFPLLLISTNIKADNGYLVDYSINGKSLGGTEMRGNLKFLFKNGIKRITGNIFYQEAGNPFPNLDEKDIIVNFDKDKKTITTSESGDKLTVSLDGDFTSIPDNKIKVDIIQSSSKIAAVINVDAAPEFGGKQKYIIYIKFKGAPDENEINNLKKIKKPTALGFISIFIDNEKIIDILNKSIGDEIYRIPDSFSVYWQVNNKKQLDVTGKLESKSVMDISEADF